MTNSIKMTSEMNLNPVTSAIIPVYQNFQRNDKEAIEDLSGDENDDGPQESQNTTEKDPNALSAFELTKAINIGHPRNNEGKPFDWLREGIGSYNDPRNPPKVKSIHQELGVGPSMYLL